MFSSPLLKIGTPAPDFNLLDQNGRIVRLENGGENGTVLLFFASHFLPGDKRLLKEFAEAYPMFREQGVDVLALSGLNWETLYHLADKMQLPYRVLFDACCRISTRYNAMTMPKFVTGRAVYFISPQREVAYATRACQPSELLRNIR